MKPKREFYKFDRDIFAKDGTLLFKRNKQYKALFRAMGSDWVKAEAGRNYDIYSLKPDRF